MTLYLLLVSDTTSVIGSSNGDQEADKNPETPVHKTNRSQLTTQYLAAGIVTVGAFASGASLSWSSTAVPILHENNFIKLGERGWVASLLCLGAFCGAVPAGLVSEYFGRKKTLLCLALPMLASWILIASSPNVWGVYVGRFVGGIATGAASVAIPAYVADVAEPRHREKFANFYQLQLAAGVLFGFVIGMARSVKTLSVLSGSLPILYFSAFAFMPESPVYLMTQGKYNEAKIALQYFRGVQSDIEEELTTIKGNICGSLKNKANFKDLVNNSQTLKALIVSFGLMSFQQLSGINAIIFYATEIFNKCQHSNSELPAIILGFSYLLSTYFSSPLLSRFSRRKLLIASFLLMSVSSCTTGVYCHLKGSGFQLYPWIPVFCLCIYISAYSCGVGPIPWLMLHQIFPTNVTRRTTAFSAGFSWFLAFGVTKVFPNMFETIGVGWVIWNFGIVSSIGALFVYFAVPETKDKTLEEIQKQLDGIRPKKKHRHIIQLVGVYET